MCHQNDFIQKVLLKKFWLMDNEACCLHRDLRKMAISMVSFMSSTLILSPNKKGGKGMHLGSLNMKKYPETKVI